MLTVLYAETDGENQVAGVNKLSGNEWYHLISLYQKILRAARWHRCLSLWWEVWKKLVREQLRSVANSVQNALKAAKA